MGKVYVLKPCPFCGSPDITVKSPNNVFCKCVNCGACGPDWDYREERALQSWTKRSFPMTDDIKDIFDRYEKWNNDERKDGLLIHTDALSDFMEWYKSFLAEKYS